MDSPIEITEAMVDAGVYQIADYEMGATDAGDFVKAVFSAMLSAGGLCLARVPKDDGPAEQRL